MAPSTGRTGVIELASAVTDPIDAIEQVLDIQQLIANGCSDGEIVKRLELADTSLVVYLRNRDAEFDDFNKD